MADEKTRTIGEVYNKLKQISAEDGVDFGLDDYTEESFSKKYGTARGTEQLYNTLKKISDEDGVDFGLPENVIDWQTSFDRGERNAKQQGEDDAALVSRVLNEGGTAADSSDARAAAQRMSGGTADTDPKYEELFGSEADRNPVGVIYNADDDKYEIVPYGEMYTLETDDEGNETVGLRGAFWSGKGAHSKFYTLDTRPMKAEDEATIKKDAYERYTLPTGQEVLRYKTIHLDGKNGLKEIEGEYAIDPRDGRLHEVLWQDADKARRAAVDKESVRAGVMRREEEANALEGSLDRVEERTRQAFSDYLSQNGVQLPDGVDIMSLGKMADVAVVNPILGMAIDKIMPIEYREAARAVSEARDMIEQARTNTSDKTDADSWINGGLRNLKSGVGNKLFDFRTWDFGITDARSALAMKRAADKFERGESLTAGEQAMMDAMANKLAVEAFFGSDLGYLYEAGQVTAESIPFMLEFIATEGAMAGADAATKSLVKYATKRFSKGAMREAARKAYNSAVGKVVRAVGDASLKGSVQAATIGAPRVVANAAERMTGEQQIGTDENGDVKTTGFTDKQDAGRAWLSAFGQQSVEWQSERMSEVFSPLFRAGKGGSSILSKLDDTLLGDVIAAMRGISHSRAVQVMKGMERRMGWHGVTGEFFEEIVGGVENSLLGLDDTTLDTNYRTGLFNPDKMLRTFLGVGVMGGMFSTANTLGYMRSARKHGNIVREGDRLFGTDDAWITLVRAGETVKGDDFSGLVDATKTILQGNYRKSQKKVALDYANSVAWLKGAEGEQAKAISELSPEQLEAQANIEEGYKAEEPGELREIATGAAQAAEVFRERNSALADTAEQMWKDGASDAEMFGFFDGLSAEDRELAEEWYAAVKRQQGVDMGTQEQIDEQTKDFQDFVDDNSADGVVTTAIYQGAEVVVKSMSEDGGMATLADGSVVPLDALENVQQHDAEEVKNNNVQTTTAAVQQEREMMQKHHEKTHLPDPDEVFYLNPENPTAYRAAQQDGMWVVIPEDNPNGGQSMSEEELLNAMDAYWDGAEAIANGEQTGDEELGVRNEELQDDEAINENENENENGQLPEEAIEPQQEYDTIQTGEDTEVRIPVFINDEGERERDYEAVEPAVAYAGMVEEAGSEDAAEQAAGIVAQNIEKDIAKARKWKPDASLKSYKKIAAAIRANNEEIQALEKRHKFWSDLANYRNSLAEAAAAAEKQAKSESKKKGNKSDKKKGSKNEPEKGTIQWREKQLGDYLNFEDYVLRVMAGGGTRVVWKDNPTTGTRGLASHTVGNIESERKKRIGILATSKKGGKYPEELAEWLWQGYKEAMNTDSDQIGQDTEDNAFNTVVGVLLRHATRGAMMAEAEARHGNAINADREAEENYTEEDWNAEKQQIFAEQEGFATYEDYLDDIDIRNEEIALTNADMQEIYAIFAEDWQSNGIESLFTDNGNNSINSENNGEEAILDAGGTRRGTGLGEESDEGAAQGGAEESGALGEEGASVAPGSAERPDGAVWDNGRQGGSSPLDAAVEPAQGNGQAGGVEKGYDDYYKEAEAEIKDIESQFDKENTLKNDELIQRISDMMGDLEEEPNRDEDPRAAARYAAAEKWMEENVWGEQPTPSPSQEEGSAALAAAEQETDTNPTDAQKKAGNYKKGHVKIDGFDITIENPKGSVRSGVDASGKRWSQTMNNTYGYIRGTEGVDGDHIDVFFSDDPSQGDVFVVDQVNKDGSFDEHKVMYGFPDIESARKAYLSNYEEGWQGLGAITPVNKEEFKKWIDSSHRKTKPFAEYSSVNTLGDTQLGEAESEEKPKRLVSDERMEELKKRLRDKLNGRMNVGVDPEMLAIGAELAVGHIERGLTKFADYAQAMIEDLGDAIRPYLKSFYNAVRDMPEAEEYTNDMDDYQTVQQYDVMSRTATPSVLDVAQGIVTERKVEQQSAEAAGELVKQNNTTLDGVPLRSATEEDFNQGERPILYHEGKRVYVVSVVRKGEQAGNAMQFTEPSIDGIYLSNGKRVKVDELMVAVPQGTENIEKTKGEPLQNEEKEVNLQSKSASGQLDLFGDLFNENEDEGTNVQAGSAEERRAGQQAEPTGEVGGSPADEAERPDTGRVGGRSESHLPVDEAGSSRVAGQHGSEADAERHVENPKNLRNNHAERGVDYAPVGVDSRIEANLAAIETMQRLMESGEEATPQDMVVLRRFSGWGGLGKAFNEHVEGSSWQRNPTRERLLDLLGQEGFRQANMSRNSAYYTPAEIIDALWDIAKALGFKGGKVLEGSAGIGNIIGAMPKAMSERSDILAVEIDGTTGNMLKQLYPDAQVEIQGFEQTQIENGSVDLAITNVPFVTGLRVNDTTGDKDLSKKFHDIHDFCIAKNIRKLREGGIGIFITSNGTLDRSQKLIEWIGNEGRTDVVGAFRLNNKTFGGTGATSDIIVVRKRVNNQKSSNAIDVSRVASTGVKEYDTGETRKVKGVEVPVVKQLTMDYNAYFVEHPEMMGGEMKFAFEEGDTFRPTSKALYPSSSINQSARLADFVRSMATKKESARHSAEIKQEQQVVYENLGSDVKEGSMLINKSGVLCVAQRGQAVPLDVNANKVKGHTKSECFAAYKKIKDAVREVLDYQTENEGDAGLQPLLDKLNRAYDAFVRTYGHLHNNTSISFLKNDVDFANILALEKYEERATVSGKKEQSFGKTDVFRQRVVEKEKNPTPKTVKDGVLASVYQHGRIDLPWIAEQLQRPEDEVRKEILENNLGYEDPLLREVIVSYEYLSGNVREKLAAARENNTDGRYDANINALEKVKPIDIPAHLIEFNLGSSWIEPSLFADYVKDKTDIDVSFANIGGMWVMNKPYWVDEQKNKAFGVRSEMLNKLVLGTDLIEAAIQNKTITVSVTNKDRITGKSETITDKEATAACAAKIDEIRQDFRDWARDKMQSDAALSAKMEKAYNDRFNNYVAKQIPQEFIPEYFAGASHKIKLEPHQSQAAMRATTQPLLFAHEVGAGKTFALITAAMEMRRLGTAQKPMIVVQNATVGQFVESAKLLYPNAKVLTIEESERTGEGRKNFYAKIKYNDWDMIVVPQSVFERIPDSVERQLAYINAKIEEKLHVLEQMRENDPRSQQTRRAEKEIEQLEQDKSELVAPKSDDKKIEVAKQNARVRAEELLDRAVDDVENFDDMGIDALLIDEAHEYKHLGFATMMQRGVKGVDPSPSKKSQGVYLKTQAVLEKNNGKNVVFATGTPVSNTAAEVWTFMRYLMPEDTMKEYGIYYFDDFVRNFGSLQQMLEFTTSGKFKENNRFAGYVNLPELGRIWSSVADIVLTSEIEERRMLEGSESKIPKIEGGKAQDIYLPQTKALRSVMLYVKQQLKVYDKMTGKEKKENSHIPLTMYGIAKAAAVDARLVMEDAADEPQSKTNEAVRQTLKSLEETKSYKGTVALFADNYQNKNTGFNLYEDIKAKLVKAGVPEKQIVVMKSGMSVKKKLEIFEAVNRGDVRVIMGSTFTLGTGVNIQERLHTLIHLDAPNRPMDYTQRNGRILRQGNIHKEMNKPVRVLRFGVEDSLDVTAYQRLKTKGAIADSIMHIKDMLANSMENRVLEEDEDVFGDTVAQLSGSEYAMLKNQAEKDVRKFEAKKKQWEADQAYCHRQIPLTEKEISRLKEVVKTEKANIEKVKDANGVIEINGKKYSDIDALGGYLKEYNKAIKAAEVEVKEKRLYEGQSRTLAIKVGGFDFKINTNISLETGRDGATLFTASRRTMTYSCAELGLEAVPVKQGLLRNAIEDIVGNIVTGNRFTNNVQNAETALQQKEKELAQMKERYNKPFEFGEELNAAKSRLDDYSNLMKAEMEAKEAKYAEMDASVEAATGITEAEEADAENEGDGKLLRDGDTFYSNAERAVEGIKQEKATPEQWLKMVEKQGGLKAGEDKWLGLSDWLKGSDKKSLTKQEVLDFIRQNQIKVEEVGYVDTGARATNESNQIESIIGIPISNVEQGSYGLYKDEYGDYYLEIDGRYKQAEEVWKAINKKYGRDKYKTDDDFRKHLADIIRPQFVETNPINGMRKKYTTRGLKNLREIALTVPTIEPWNTADDVHFGDAGEGRAVAWIRFGETTDIDGKRVLVIDEIQSERHQEGREKGYKNESFDDVVKVVVDNYTVPEQYVRNNPYDVANIIDRYDPELAQRLRESYGDNSIPAAPFEKNWHELAMKRMLRYAAENGYDKVAWTTGEQQAERYNLGTAVDFIETRNDRHEGKIVYIRHKDGNQTDLILDENGNIDYVNSRLQIRKGTPLSDIVGKEIANKIMSYDGAGSETYAGENLRIGGDGMKGFYDQMLPRFMDKYGKKWGVKTGKVELPNIGGSQTYRQYLETGKMEKGGLDMWAVDVTPEMKESVMEGQPMFREGDFDYLSYVPTRKLGARVRRQDDNFARRQARRARDIAEETVERLGLQDTVTIYNNIDEVPGYEMLSKRERMARGWYDRRTGKIAIVLGNHLHVQTLPQDVLESVLHEAVAHYGLRRLFGENFNQFLDNVYDAASLDIRREIDDLQERGMSRRDATEEYLASLAEDTNFERAQRSGWWQQLKMLFFDMLHKIGLPGFSGVELGDAELRYILWRSYKNLESPGEYRNMFGGVLEVAQDVSVQNRLKVGNYAQNREQRTENRGLTQAAEYGMERSLFDDTDENIGEAEPRRTVDAAGAFLNANDEELLERIGETLGMEQALLSDEYDRRHRSEYEKEGNRYWQMLTDDNTSFDDAAGMYANVYGQWVNGGYASAERTKLQAQLDALREWADEKEEEEEGSRLLREGERTNPILRERLDAYMPAVERANNYVEYVMRKEYKLPDADEMIIVDSEQMAPEELGSFMGLEPEDIEDAREFLQNQLDNKKVKGVTNLESGKIVIFANKLSTIGKLRRTVLHEAVHVYQTKYRGKEKLTSLLWEHRDAFPEEMTALENLYGDYEENWPIELLAHVMESSSKSHDYSRVAAVMTTAEEREALDNYINYIEYDKRRVVKETSPDGRAGEGERGVEEGSEQERLRDNDGRGFGSDGRLTLLAKIDSDAGARDEYERALEATGYRLQEAWQDSMLGLKKLQEAIAKESGREIGDYENAYMAENLMTSMNKDQIDAYGDKVYVPLLKEEKKLLDQGISKNDLKKYIIAKHGLERNEVMAQRDAEREAKKWADEQIVKLQQKVTEYSTEIKGLEDKDTLTAGESERLAKLRDWVAHWGDHIKDVEDKQSKQAEKLAKKNRSKDYSGLTSLMEEKDTAEAEAAAAKLVEEFEKDYDIDPLWEAINTATGVTLLKEYQSGLMSKEAYEKIRGMYKYYIPLRDWEEKTATDMYDYFGYKKPMIASLTKVAHGRTTVAKDPIATIGNMADSAIIRGNRNLMKQHFLRMVLNHKSNAVSIDKLWMEWDETEQEWKPKLPNFKSLGENPSSEAVSALIEDHNKRMEELAEQKPWKYKERKELPNEQYIVLPAQLGEHQVSVKQGGKEYIITINGNPRAAQALNGETNPNSDNSILLSGIRALNRFQAAVYTSYSPAFAIKNLVRDLGYTMCVSAVAKEGTAYAKRYGSNYATVLMRMPHLLAAEKKGTLDMNNPIERAFHDFLRAGGETGYTVMKGTDEYIKNNKNWLRAHRGGLWGAAYKTANVTKVFSFLSRATELNGRFAAFLTSRELGRSVQRSAYDAKEISVNFNRKGSGIKGKVEAGEWNALQRVLINSAATFSSYGREFVIFWNAAVQSVANLAGVLVKSKKARRRLVGVSVSYMLLGAMQPWLNALLAGDDGDDEYWKLPEYVRRKNLCIYVGEGKFVKIPIALELSAFFAVGEITTSILAKQEKDGWKATSAAYVDALSQLMPINFVEGEAGLTALAPSALQPVIQTSINKSWTGTPIYKENTWNEKQPEWTKAYKGTSPLMVKIAEKLNYITGGGEYGEAGNEAQSGIIDINPATVEYLLNNYLGGPMTLTNQIITTAMMPFSNDAKEVRNIPLVSAFLHDVDTESTEHRILEANYHRLKEKMDKVNALRLKLSKAAEDESLPLSKLEDAAKNWNKLQESKEYAQWEVWHELEKEVNKAHRAGDAAWEKEAKAKAVEVMEMEE